MQAIKRIFDFYIFGNIHVAIAVFCLTKITLLDYSIENNLMPLFAFFSTIVSYNFIRMYKVSEIQHWTARFVEEHKKGILIITVISLGLIIYLSFLLKLITLLALVPFIFFTIFYVVPIPVKKNNSFSLRSVAFLKLFLIAISWAGVTVLVPLINYDIELKSVEIVLFIQRFLFVVVITIPFDIRDVKLDADHLKTLPQVIGIVDSKRVGLLFLMLFLGLEFFKDPINALQFRIQLIIALFSLFFLFRATVDQNKYFSSFFVESLPIVWFLLIIVF